jgi:hypothetical protein
MGSLHILTRDATVWCGVQVIGDNSILVCFNDYLSFFYQNCHEIYNFLFHFSVNERICVQLTTLLQSWHQLSFSSICLGCGTT